MSGNRRLHRERVCPDAAALWGLASTGNILSDRNSNKNNNSKNSQWTIWMTGSEGGGGHIVRGFSVEETSLQDKQDRLEASALRLKHTYTCLDVAANAASTGSLGGSCLDVVRNHTGEDRSAGDWLLMSLDMSNVARIWNLTAGTATATATNNKTNEEDGRTAACVTTVESTFTVENATGTAAVLLPPRLVPNSSSSGSGTYQDPLEKVVVVAVPCLDGTISLVSTGIPVFNPNNKRAVDPSKLPPAGALLETWGSPAAATGGGGGKEDVPLCLAWNPVRPLTLAVTSNTGMVHIYSKTIGTGAVRHVRLNHLGSSPARAVAYTTDGNLLAAGNDQGRLCLWDCSSSSSSSSNKQQQQTTPALVHHALAAHSSWILRLVSVDDRRFCTLGADKAISVWSVGQMHHQAMHTFQSNQSLWSLALGPQQGGDPPRLAAGSDDGWLEIFSLESS